MGVEWGQAWMAFCEGAGQGTAQNAACSRQEAPTLQAACGLGQSGPTRTFQATMATAAMATANRLSGPKGVHPTHSCSSRPPRQTTLESSASRSPPGTRTGYRARSAASWGFRVRFLVSDERKC